MVDYSLIEPISVGYLNLLAGFLIAPIESRDTSCEDTFLLEAEE